MEREESRRHGTESEEQAEEEVEEGGRLTRCSSDTRQQLQSRGCVGGSAGCVPGLPFPGTKQPAYRTKKVVIM